MCAQPLLPWAGRCMRSWRRWAALCSCWTRRCTRTWRRTTAPTSSSATAGGWAPHWEGCACLCRDSAGVAACVAYCLGHLRRVRLYTAAGTALDGVQNGLLAQQGSGRLRSAPHPPPRLLLHFKRELPFEEVRGRGVQVEAGQEENTLSRSASLASEAPADRPLGLLTTGRNPAAPHPTPPHTHTPPLQVLRLWEALWAGTPGLHLFMCVAVLEQHRRRILRCARWASRWAGPGKAAAGSRCLLPPTRLPVAPAPLPVLPDLVCTRGWGFGGT